MAQRYVGVDLGTHHVKIAVVAAGLRSIQVVDAFEVPVRPRSGDESVDPLSEVLATALAELRERGLANEPVGVSLPAGISRYRVLSFPFADERRIAQTLQFEAEGQFPVPLEQLTLDHVVVPGASEGGRALVVAARKDRIEQLAGVVREAGVDLKMMTAGSLALAQALDVEVPEAAPAGTENTLQPVKLVVDVGHQFTECIAVGAKGPVAVRTIRRGGRQVTEAIMARYRLDLPQAEASKQRDAFLPHANLPQLTADQQESARVIVSAMDPLVRQIEHTRLWLRATYRAEVTSVILAGGGSDLAGFAEYLAEQTGLPIEPARIKNAWVRGRGLEASHRLAVAIGTAFGAARRPLVQLRDEVAGQSESGWLQERLPSLIGIGVAVLAFGALDTLAQLRAADAELEAYQQELAQASQKVFGEALSARDVEAKMAAVEGEDLMRVIPQRGALEVLELITKAATPTDLPTAAASATAPVGAPVGEDTADADDDETGGDAQAAPPTTSGPVAMSSGIVMADDLRISTLDIRERKIEIKVEANSSSAQDRLEFKLRQIGCITNIVKGKVRGDTRRSFDMTMDNNCFTSSESAEDEGDE